MSNRHHNKQTPNQHPGKTPYSEPKAPARGPMQGSVSKVNLDTKSVQKSSISNKFGR